MLGKINHYLPEDIDLTEDEVFRKQTTISINGNNRDLLPWEKLTNGSFYLNTVSDNDLSWFGDLEELTFIDEINSDDDLMTTNTSNNITYTLSTVSGNRIISSGTVTSDINTVIRRVLNVPFSETTYKNTSRWFSPRYKYNNLETELNIPSKEFSDYELLYEKLPFSPKFKGTAYLPSKINFQFIRLRDMKYVPVPIKSLDIEDFKYDEDETYSYLKYKRNSYRYDDLPFSKYEWEENKDYYLTIPWEESNRIRFTFDRNQITTIFSA